MRLAALVAVSAVFLAGCSTKLTGMPHSQQLVTSYVLSESQTASIGDPMVEIERAKVRDAYVSLVNGETAGMGIQRSKLALSEGMRFTVVAYNPQDPSILYIRPEGQVSTTLISINKDGTVNQGWVLTNGTVPLQGDWGEDQWFELSDSPSRGDGSFKAQLVYSGREGDSLKAIYREFSNDYARPAFTQELQYDLSESSTIAFRTLSLEILEATNSNVTFIVHEDGGLPWLPAAQ